MRKFLLLTTLAAAAVVAAGITVQAQTYGPGMMGGDGPAYRGGHGYGPGYGYGMMGDQRPGWMMGFDSDYRGARRGRGNRGQNMCWKETDSSRGYGYYERCRN